MQHLVCLLVKLRSWSPKGDVQRWAFSTDNRVMQSALQGFQKAKNGLILFALKNRCELGEKT